MDMASRVSGQTLADGRRSNRGWDVCMPQCHGYDEIMAIDVTAQIRYWCEGAADDLEAARALLEAGKVRQAAFFVHLAIEKAAKACVVAATRDLPPRSHDLLMLVQRAGILLSEPQREFLARVQTYCLEGRYSTEWPIAPTAAAVARDLQQAAEVIQWLIGRLNNP